MRELSGLQLALIALSFYRARHHREQRFKNPKRQRAQQTVSHYPENCRLTRQYVARARAAGWRGSIRKALGVE